MGSALFMVCLLALLTPRASEAQVLYGTLVGSVTDATGAAIVGATVVATDTATNIAKTAMTDGSGNYRINNLAASTYKVEISAKSFGSTEGQGIEVQTNDVQRFDAQLQPAKVGQTVLVTGAPPDLQTDTAVVSSDIETNLVQNLDATPGANMRNFQSLYITLSWLYASDFGPLGSREIPATRCLPALMAFPAATTIRALTV